MELEFPVKKQSLQNAEDYPDEDIDIAYDFAKKVHEELSGFIKALVLFGSVARNKSPADTKKKSELGGKITGEEGEKSESNDIDILIIVDDVSFKLTKELVQTYRLMVERMVRRVSDDLHVITLKFTSFWEYVRSGDPVAVNVLRDGVPILDTGFFEPLQALLSQGRIRPSPESVWSYFKKAPKSLQSSKWHINQAVIDLYWAVIDAAHAALMKLNEVPPSPDHVSEMIEKKLVKPGVVDARYAEIMQKFYDLMKDITRGGKKIDGGKYEELYDEAKDFVDEMEDFLNS